MRKRPPRPIDFLAAFLLFGGIAVSNASRADDEAAATRVRDLYYGEVLFQFYKQDDFTALTHLLAARDAGRVSHHEAEAELLLGGLYLSYGQHDQAADIFERLLAQSASPGVQDRAWFYLGKMRYQRGLYPDALAAFSRVGPNLPDALAAELPMLVAQCHMSAGDFGEAQRVLAAWDAPDSWLAYARYNLGVTLVRLDRLAEGAVLLDQVGRMDARGDEDKDLRDKANLALGYAWLQMNDAARAKPVLQRVRLRGPFASKALLGVGWADAVNADYRSALVPWLELVDRDLMDSAVQESFLAVPYALGHLQAHGSAVARYEQALDTFDAEMGQLDGAITRARTGELIPALLKDDEADLGRWYWRLQSVPDNADSRYLYHLLADHDFQEGFKNYRDLYILSRNLADWRQRLETFSDMVDARVAGHAQKLPGSRARLATVDMDALQARRDQLASRLDQAESSRDIVALGTETERGQWQRLEALAALPDFHAPENAGLRQRHRLLQGVLSWDMDREFRARVWRERRKLGDLDKGLADARVHLAAVNEAQTGEPRRFEEFARRISDLAPRIAVMQVAVDRTLDQEQDRLVALAVQELQTQKERLASYRVQARFALAGIYDRAAATQAAAPAVAPP